MLSCMSLTFEAWYSTFKNYNSGISLMLTFILALISGYSTNYVEPALLTFLKPRLDSVHFDVGEYKTLTFILLLFLVAIFGFLANETVDFFPLKYNRMCVRGIVFCAHFISKIYSTLHWSNDFDRGVCLR